MNAMRGSLRTALALGFAFGCAAPVSDVSIQRDAIVDGTASRPTP